MGTIIDAVASYTPSEIIKSSELMQEIQSETRFGIAHTWIDNKVGIHERRFSDERRPSDLAIKAAKKAFSISSITPADIDLIIYCGIDKDYEEPSTAHNVQHAIGAKNAYSHDISNACHGFIDAIHTVNSHAIAGEITTALICTGEQPSKITKAAIDKLKRKKSTRQDFKNYLGGFTCGDAGAAMILKYVKNNRGFKFFNIRSYPQYAELCYYKKTEKGLEGVMIMDKICKAFLEAHVTLFKKTLTQTCDETIDYLITHQVGKRPHQRLAEIVGFPLSRVPATYPMRGNITSATIPTVLTEGLKICNNSINKNLLLFGIGSGVTVSQSLYIGQ